MSSIFDHIIERRGTNSLKWDYCQQFFQTDDLLPMWVADADWSSPPEIIEAIVARAKHGVFGYTRPGQELDQVVVEWVNRHYHWEIKPEWLVYIAGVVSALNLAIKAVISPGDEIIVQSPVYYPFFGAVKNNGAQLLNNQLLLVDQQYHMNFEHLAGLFKVRAEERRQPRVKMAILCNPHNPVGRVWTEEELRRFGEICLEHGVLVVTDEIHADFIYTGQKFTPFASVSPDFVQNSITLLAPSKTFNIAGLNSSLAIIPDQKTRKLFQQAGEGFTPAGNILGFEAMKAAYSRCDYWLEKQLSYLESNLDFAMDFISSKMPLIKAIKPEGSYLLWLDCRQLSLDGKELNTFMAKRAKVALDPGDWFGPGGEGFMRINIACPRSLLKEGLERIAAALSERR